MYALVRCPTADVAHGDMAARRRHSTIMNQLTSISEIASRYRFTELGRLAGIYRTIFGEISLRDRWVIIFDRCMMQRLPYLHSG